MNNVKVANLLFLILLGSLTGLEAKEVSSEDNPRWTLSGPSLFPFSERYQLTEAPAKGLSPFHHTRKRSDPGKRFNEPYRGNSQHWKQVDLDWDASSRATQYEEDISEMPFWEEGPFLGWKKPVRRDLEEITQFHVPGTQDIDAASLQYSQDPASFNALLENPEASFWNEGGFYDWKGRLLGWSEVQRFEVEPPTGYWKTRSDPWAAGDASSEDLIAKSVGAYG